VDAFSYLSSQQPLRRRPRKIVTTTTTTTTTAQTQTSWKTTIASFSPSSSTILFLSRKKKWNDQQENVSRRTTPSATVAIAAAAVVVSREDPLPATSSTNTKNATTTTTMPTTEPSARAHAAKPPPYPHPPPVYITIGPPCCGKSEALRACLEQDGYDPDTVLSQDVAIDESSNAYCRIPLAAFIYPMTQLDPKLGAKVLFTRNRKQQTDVNDDHDHHHASSFGGGGGSLLSSSPLSSSSSSPPPPQPVTLQERLLQPNSIQPSLERTDDELRNIILRVAGRLTQQDFADRTRALAWQAGDTVKFFRFQRLAVAEDLIKAVETASAQAVGEVLFHREVIPLEQQVGLVLAAGDDPEDHDDLPYGEKQTPLPLPPSKEIKVELKGKDKGDADDDNRSTTLSSSSSSSSSATTTTTDPSVQEDTSTTSTTTMAAATTTTTKTITNRSNTDTATTTTTTTSAHLLSARALIRTPYVDLFIPEALFEGGIQKAEQRLMKLLQPPPQGQPQESSSSLSSSSSSLSLSLLNLLPVAWSNTNTRPMEYASALAAAQAARRPVRFVAWGTRHLPRVSRGELLRRNVERFRCTGRYIPCGAVGAALGRVERLIQVAQQEADQMFRSSRTTSSTTTSTTPTTTNTRSTEFKRNDDDDNNDGDDDKDDDDKKGVFESKDWKDYEIYAAFASLAGYVMDEDGYVTKVTEPRNLHSKSRLKNARNSS
jgi:hypothetical protein